MASVAARRRADSTCSCESRRHPRHAAGGRIRPHNGANRRQILHVVFVGEQPQGLRCSRALRHVKLEVTMDWGQGSQNRVVLVDDDQFYLEVIAAELGDCGFSVRAFSDGATFLEALDVVALANAVLLDWTLSRPVRRKHPTCEMERIEYTSGWRGKNNIRNRDQFAAGIWGGLIRPTLCLHGRSPPTDPTLRARLRLPPATFERAFNCPPAKRRNNRNLIGTLFRLHALH